MNTVFFVLRAVTAAFLLGATTVNALAGSLVGDVFPEQGEGGSLFQVERFWTTNGNQQTLTECFKETNGVVAASLVAEYVAHHLQDVRFEQKQSHEQASARFENGRVYYLVVADGKTKKSDQSVSTEWTPFPAVPDQILKNWGTLIQGGTVKLKIPIPILRDNFTFEITRSRTWVDGGKQSTEFKLEPSSFVIRMLAGAMYYVFEDKTRNLIEYRGRTMARTEKNGKLEDLNAIIKYRAAALSDQKVQRGLGDVRD